MITIKLANGKELKTEHGIEAYHFFKSEGTRIVPEPPKPQPTPEQK